MCMRLRSLQRELVVQSSRQCIVGSYSANMLLCTVLGLIVLATPSLAGKMCTTLDHLKGVEANKFLPGSQIVNLTMSGIMTCSRACLFRRRCQSFNFNTETGECQLNSQTVDSADPNLDEKTNFVFSDISHWPQRLAGVCANHTCPLNSYCDPVNNTYYGCRSTGCLGIPNIEDGHMNETHAAEDECPLRSTLSYTCDPGYMPQGEVVCQDDGSWSSPGCASVSSCSMVKRYQPDSGDGEYWLRLTNFDNYTTQIYCHNMTKPSPKEFLTLPNINYGIYPQIMNEDCTVETELRLECTGEDGEIWFNKIRVNVTNMKVFRVDKTFADISHSGGNFKFAHAADCYTADTSNCGTDIQGNFTLDLRGTGWRVGEEQTWETFGRKPKTDIDRQMNGTLIILRCGGFAGGCRPAGTKLVLTPYPEGIYNYNP